MNGNVHPDMLRQGLPQAAMLSMNTPFLQNMQQSSQQQLATSHLGLPPSSNPPNASMMLNNAPGPMNPNQQRYQIQLQQNADARQQRPMQMRPGQPGQPMMGPSNAPLPGGAAGPHMVGMGHGQTMTYNPSMMTQASGNVAVRRVSSQPQMTQGPGAMGGMSPNAGSNNLSIGMPPQGNMTQIRQIPQGMQHQLRMQGQVHMPNQMSPDMPMSMNRQVGNPGLPGRTSSAQAQLMNSLSQPPSMQHSMVPQQNQFQNSVQIPSQHPQQIPSPRPGSQTHTPSMNMSTPGPSQPPQNRPPMNSDDTMSFMNYPNAQFSQPQHTTRMPPTTNGQFPFVPSTPPGSLPDMPQPGLGTPGGTTSRTSFQLTPAQQFEQMNSPENYASTYNMPPPSHVPPRPPSQISPHPPSQLMSHPPLPHQQQLSHHSPHPSDSHVNHPQRPQSQPQAMPRPPSQPVQTPRSAQSQLPGSAPPPGRMGLPPHGPQPPSRMSMTGPGPSSQHLSIAPRPPPQGLPGAGPPGVAPPPQVPSDTSPTAAARTQNAPPLQVGQGQGLIRLLQFSGVLSSENKDKLQLAWWNDLIKEYFTPKAMLRFTLWKDNQRNEAKQFEIGVPILPRFFLVTTQSGVKSMTLSLDGARERMYAPGHAVVECVSAVWTYKYNNGYTVTLRGPLTAHVVVTTTVPPGTTPSQSSRPNSEVALKFDDFEFNANLHDKYIALDSITGLRTIETPKTPHIRNSTISMPNGTPESQQQRQHQLEEDKKWEEPRVTISPATIPGEPVNAFGIPQATMRCLELAESVSAMAELISFSTEQNLGPREALHQFAARLRVIQPFNQPLINNSHPNHLPPTSLTPMHSNASTASAVTTLYSSAPSSVTNPSGNPHTPTGTTVSPKNAPLSASNSPQKQHKTIPQQTPGASSSSTGPASSPAVSSGATNNTPAMPNASLKRKQGGDATSSPTITNVDTQPPQKRQNRRRRTTNATGPGTGGG